MATVLMETGWFTTCSTPNVGEGAPRAFSMKLSGVTRGAKCRFKPTTMDKELEVRRTGGRIEAISAKHVDDIKIGGDPKIIRN